MTAMRKVGDTQTAQALGHAILHLARILEDELTVPVLYNVELARAAAKAAAFKGLDKVGDLGTKGLIAGERWAHKNAAELRELGEAIEEIRDRLGKQAMVALSVMEQSSSAGARALLDLIVRANGGIDAAGLTAAALQRDLERLSGKPPDGG